MNIPLLQKDQSTASNVSINGAPKKKMAGLFGQAILQKYDIKNEIISKVKLSLDVSEDFLEKSVAGIHYNVKEEVIADIYDTSLSGRLTDSKKVFEGLRTKKREIMKEHNFVMPGIVTECNDIIYLGCKDGTVHVADQKDDKGDKKKFVPHNGKDVMSIAIKDNFLVTLSVTQEMVVWDAKQFIESDKHEPEKLLTAEKVTSFELQVKNSKVKLFYCKDSAIYETTLHHGQAVQEGEESTRELERLDHAAYIYHAEDDKILFADKYENVYLLTRGEGDHYDAKLLLEKQAGNITKFLYYKDEIVTIVQNDTSAKETIFITINLIRLEEDEEEQRRKDEELKKKEKDEEEKKNSMSEQEFKLWKMQQHQIEASEHAVDIKKKETGIVVEQVKEETVVTKVLSIGECGGVSFSHSKEELLVSGTHHFVIFGGRRWEEQLFEVQTETQTSKALFSSSGNTIYIFSNDGNLKIMDWRNPQMAYPPFIKDSEIQEVVGTKDGKYFATLSQNQSRICIYSYLDCTVKCQFDHMEYTYLMNFSADSSSLVCVQGTSEAQVFNIVLIRIEAKPLEQITVIPCKISEDYPIQIDASLTKQEIYMIAKSANSSNLHIYGFDRRVKKTIRDATALSVSTDEKVLAYANTSNQVHMIFIKQKLPDLPQKRQRSPSKKLTNSPSKRNSIADSPTKRTSQLTPEEEVDEKVINTLELQDNAIAVQFYSNNLRIAVQTSNSIMGIDVYTHQVIFKIQNAGSQLLFKRIQVQFDDFVNFCDASQRLYVYDINYKLDSDYVSLKTKPLRRFDLQINHEHHTAHAAWAAVGNHIVLQQEDRLWFQANPYMHHQLENEVVHSGPYEEIEGLFVPTLLGGPKLGTGSFAQMYNQSIIKDKEDLETMMLPIYPYKLNALHYFAMTSNVAGAEACFANKVRFTLDQFGKSPLDYAIKTKDKLIIEAILTGIDTMENEEKIKILRSLPLNLLVEHPAPVLANILLQSGASVPVDSAFGKGATVPTLFPIKGQGFGESGMPYYSVEVAAQLHPANRVKPSAKYRPVSTFVLNNPVPRNFTDDSLGLLASIVDCSNDEIVRSKPITLYLNRKWDSYGYQFYFTQFVMFISLLMALTALDSNKNYYIILTSFIISVSINTYFFIFELFQLAILRFEYFTSFANMLDIGRLAAIYTYLFSVIDADFELPSYVLPTTFLLMWLKILSYLSVFKPTRYLIKMIFEIINDITTFLIILFTALFAYGQITFVLTTDVDAKDFQNDLKNSYVLSLGELGDFPAFGYLQFFIFIMFSFLVPLVLMNMLIALMADSYTRVQSNAVAADARALAEMLQEMEEVFQFIFSVFRPSLIRDEYYYCFVTKVNDEEEEEDWEGTVGQLKSAITEATTILEQNLINAVDDISKKNCERIIDNMLKANKQEMDIIDSVQKVLEKETASIRTTFEQQMLDESQKVKDQFKHTMEKLDEDAKQFQKQFEKTHIKLENDYQEVKNEFKRTQTKMEEDAELVKKEFQKTHEQITVQGVEVKADLKKAHEEIESTSKTMQTEIKLAQEKVETQSQQMKNELKKAHEMITDVNSQVVSTSSQIVQNVQSSTAKTQDSLLQKIESQSKEDTSKVQTEVEKQSKHHDEMVTFAVDTQKKVTDLLASTSEQQSKLLLLVDELKTMQNKGLESMKNAEDELMRKKEFEKAQNEAVDTIKALLGDLKKAEENKTKDHFEEIKTQEQKEAALKHSLKTIQDNLAKIQASEEERIKRLEEAREKEEKVSQELSSISKTLLELGANFGKIKSSKKKDESSSSDDEKEEKKQGKGKKKGQ